MNRLTARACVATFAVATAVLTAAPATAEPGAAARRPTMRCSAQVTHNGIQYSACVNLAEFRPTYRVTAYGRVRNATSASRTVSYAIETSINGSVQPKSGTETIAAGEPKNVGSRSADLDACDSLTASVNLRVDGGPLASISVSGCDLTAS